MSSGEKLISFFPFSFSFSFLSLSSLLLIMLLLMLFFSSSLSLSLSLSSLFLPSDQVPLLSPPVLPAPFPVRLDSAQLVAVFSLAPPAAGVALPPPARLSALLPLLLLAQLPTRAQQLSTGTVAPVSWQQHRDIHSQPVSSHSPVRMELYQLSRPSLPMDVQRAA